MTTTTPTRVLADDKVYSAHDTYVCGETMCAGATAVFTGRTIGGAKVTAVTAADVRDWNSYPELGPLTCQCGRLTVIIDPKRPARVQHVRTVAA